MLLLHLSRLGISVVLLLTFTQTSAAQIVHWENNIEVKFWDESQDTGDPERYMQGWLEMIDHNTGSYGWRWMSYDKYSNQLITQWEEIYPGDFSPSSWGTNGLGSGGNSRYWGHVACTDPIAVRERMRDRMSNAIMAGISTATGTFYGTSMTGPAAVLAAANAGMATVVGIQWWSIGEWFWHCIM